MRSSPRWTPDVQLCASQSTAAGVRGSQTVTAGQSHSVTGWSAAGGGGGGARHQDVTRTLWTEVDNRSESSRVWRRLVATCGGTLIL